MGWSDPLSKTIVPSKGSPIKTLADARDYLLNLPKSRQKEEIVQAAVGAILMAADGRGPILHATAGIGAVVNGPFPMQLPNRSKWKNVQAAIRGSE
jgi:hypothetical protein